MRNANVQHDRTPAKAGDYIPDFTCGGFVCKAIEKRLGKHGSAHAFFEAENNHRGVVKISVAFLESKLKRKLDDAVVTRRHTSNLSGDAALIGSGAPKLCGVHT